MKNAATLIVVALVAALVGAVAGRYVGTPAASVAPAATPGGSAAPGERKVLYYRNPMGLPDTSPVPKKDPMGMDYVAVYADDAGATAAAAGAVRISPDKVQALGVRSEAAQRRRLGRSVRAAGTVVFDERGQHVVAPRFDGWIETLHVNTGGQPVTRGQALAEVYSPELVSAQREFLIAQNTGKALAGGAEDARVGFRDLANAAQQRLRNWGIGEAQIRQLADSGEVRRTLTLLSPATGVVVDKPAVAGKRFMAGEALFQIGSIGTVWLVADVFEQDLGLIRIGQAASVKVGAFPERSFAGKVAFIAPALAAETRTAKLRIELPNPDGILRPQMFAAVEIATGEGREVLSVPDSALIDSGARQVVLVQLAEGRFEPRPVRIGQRADGYVEIREGLRDGEMVVTRANFLIDAESNLKAALGGMSSAAPAAAPAATTHAGDGRIEAIDVDKRSLVVSHGPIESLRWPAMKMPLAVADAALLKGLAPGMAVRFELQEQDSGEYAIVRLAPAAKTAAPAAGAAAAHGSH